MGISAKHEDHYANPVVSGKRLHTTGRIAEKYVRRDRPFIVIETECVDEDGREIVRSRHTFMLGGIQKPSTAGGS